MTRILQVLTDTDRRGSQLFAVRLERVLAERGWDVRSVALTAGGYPPPLPVPALGRLPRHPQTLRALRAEMRLADVVIAFGAPTLSPTITARSRVGVPIIYRSAADALRGIDTPEQRLRLRVLLGNVQRVCVLWPEARQLLVNAVGIPSGRISMIPSGVTTRDVVPPDAAAQEAARRRFGLDPDPERPVLLSVGALAPEHRIDALLGAVAREPAWQALIVGDGLARARLAERAAALAPDRVAFAGPLPDLAPCYDAADVAVLLSDRGGTAGFLMEAGARGVPAVATDVGGLPWIVVDGVTGALVPVTPGVDAVRDGVRRVLDGHASMGLLARQQVEAWFDLETVAGEWEKLLADVGR
ncbi:glycosyltransferase [Egibacter rhizosphaerae]|uniref:Glycosyltransferase n=1 Tax=Egibacter rhizosphaerae TaxID=1670831 RepID=A0A411YGG1_9ACTN|nr:glycosyltransferase family 4 protein [Egibacter rhizosphaerae]QBI20308.1 glycosyltransferase [Egibacter rhizosphaerae]